MGLWQNTFNAFGFSKGYNFIFCKTSPQNCLVLTLLTDVITIGALIGFSLARFQYLSFGIFCSGKSGGAAAAPGECYYYEQSRYKVGIQMHLASIIPAAFLVCFQFTPVIRHKFLLFHKINGYIIIVLAQISTVGALMIVRTAFGGTLATQAGIGLLVILATTGMALAYVNIKRLQIDQHRAWMIRTWAYVRLFLTQAFTNFA